MKITELDVDRFFEFVEKSSGCWIWKGAKSSTGYGTFSINGKTERAHRISAFINGLRVPAGMCVCHKCDVRECVNPEHLFIASQKDNVADAMTKNRHSVKNGVNPMIHDFGENHHSAKLDEGKVLEMRRIHSPKCGFGELGKMFGVSKFAAKKAVTGKTWAHVK